MSVAEFVDFFIWEGKDTSPLQAKIKNNKITFDGQQYSPAELSELTKDLFVGFVTAKFRRNIRT